MIKLSVAIITYNEELNILRCLDSVQSVADEIVIVDSGSTDKTLELINNKPVTVHHQDFLGHIEQKNLAISKCSFEYILSLDADEALSEELQQAIIRVKQNWVQDAYSFNRLTNYCGQWIKHCGWYPDKKVRLFKKGEAKWGGTNPHDKLEVKNNQVHHLHGDLLHYSFYTVEQHKKQIDYFTDISSNALFEKGKRSSYLQLLFSPVAKFIQSYFLQLGFLEGKNGLIISWLSAGSKYKKYHKLMQLQK
ncbi:MAG: glycosyltransferase family 2 protein [Bacteroidia bacterium]|nr:glycosyltransferase family 2 protein [Bacteroidia bacterium]